MIIPIYKPVGASSHQLAQKTGQMVGEKATHTGTLDPIASGVLTVLTGEDRFSKEKYADVAKKYRCTVLLGFTTDTHDVLGLIQRTHDVSAAEVKTWSEYIPHLVGKHLQQMPHFSAKRHQGKSFFSCAKDGRASDLPEISVAIGISDARVESSNMLSSTEVLETITKKIALVEGDFRQKKIVREWERELPKFSTTRTITFQITCTKRTYVRAIVRDLAEKTGIPGCVLSLERVANGSFTISDCICLV